MGATDTMEIFFERLNSGDRRGAVDLMDERVEMRVHVRDGSRTLRGLQQVGGWFLTALWVAPVYAYLMLASAWARRSPFLAAIAPVLALIFIEGLLLGTDFVGTAIKNHVPHYIGGESVVGFYFNNAFWAQIDYFSLFSGLVFAAVAVVACVYLRRYRFEI